MGQIFQICCNIGRSLFQRSETAMAIEPLANFIEVTKGSSVRVEEGRVERSGWILKIWWS